MLDGYRFEAASTDDSGKIQKVSGLGMAGEAPTNVLRLGQFGLAAHAPKGSHGFVLSPRGNADLAVLLGLEHPDKRPASLPEGASKLYDASGNMIFCALDNGLTISAASGDVVVKSATGKIYLGGSAGASPVMTVAGPSSTVFAKV